MATEICQVCFGSCYFPTGQYEACYTCGGRGYGMSTDASCVACNGRGQSTKEVLRSCWNCHGLGYVTKTTRAQEATTGTRDTRSSDPNGFLFLLAFASGVVAYLGDAGPIKAVAVGLGVLLAGKAFLPIIAAVLRSTLRLALRVVVVGALLASLMLGAYALNIDWAVNFFENR